MRGIWVVILATACLGPLVAVGQDRMPVEATTATGEKVLLHPDGRWEYVDRKKQAEAEKAPERAQAAAARGTGAPASAASPTQGGLFGIGRTIQPGDPDYNRGSLNPKTR
jgi:hypothetical protein